MSKCPMKPLVPAILVTLVMQLAAAQAPSSNTGNSEFTLSVGTRLVEIPVTVLSADGKTVDNLLAADFEVYEDNERQDITLFKHEDTPIRSGVVINAYRGQPDLKAVVESAASIFIRESHPNNRTFIVDFYGAYSFRKEEFSDSIRRLVEALIEVDSFRRAPPEVSPGSTRKAVLVIVDGDGLPGVGQLLSYLNDARDVAIYPIGILDEKQKAAAKLTRDQLTQVAKQTGGEAYFPKSVDEVEGICRRIAHDLRNQYTLGYSPKNSRTDGTWRSIRVTVTAGKPVVRAKQGYVATLE